MPTQSDISKLNRDITAFAKNEGKNAEVIQSLLVRAAVFVFDTNTHHNNCDPLTRIVNVCVGRDAATLLRWCEANLPVLWRANENGVRAFKFNRSAKMVLDIEHLKSAKWWLAAKKASQVATEVDFSSLLADFIKRMEREVAKAKVIKNREVLTEAKALSGRLAAAQIK